MRVLALEYLYISTLNMADLNAPDGGGTWGQRCHGISPGLECCLGMLMGPPFQGLPPHIAPLLILLITPVTSCVLSRKHVSALNIISSCRVIFSHLVIT